MTYFSRPIPSDLEARDLAARILRWVSVDSSLIELAVDRARREGSKPQLVLADALRLLVEVLDSRD
jgi:hypothetical protein